MDNLGLPDLSVVLVWIVGATVFLVQKAKSFVCRHFKGRWTQRVPWWAWLGLSIAIPFGLVFLVVQPWAQNIINGMLPDALDLNFPENAAVPTALTAVLGANGAYAVSKRLGLTADYSAGGPLDVTKPEEPVVAPTMPEAGVTTTEDESSASALAPLAAPAPAPVLPPEMMPTEEEDPLVKLMSGYLTGKLTDEVRLLVEWRPGLPSPTVAILGDDPASQTVHRVAYDWEGDWVAGPTEASPNHVLIPKDWNRPKDA